LDHNSKITAKGDYITIPDQEDAGWVIDGQHRLAGAHQSKLEIEIVVVAFLGLAENEQINQFVTINREAKGVPTSLYYDLLKHLPTTTSDADVAKQRAVDIAHTLGQDNSSPFYQRIVIEAPKKGQMSLTNFVRKVSPLVIDKKGKFHTYTLFEQLNIIDNYYRALEHVFSKAFSGGDAIFFKTLGFGAAINALPTVFDLSLREFHAFRVEDAAKVLTKVEYFDLAEWEKLGTGTAAELQAGEDFRQELLKNFNENPDAGTLRLK
jgi:DGQHR domain-containing protein